MTAPICPVMISGMIGGAFCAPTSRKFECLGSRCAWWKAERIEGARYVGGGGYNGPGPNGTCARNPSGEPYPDPAREGEG